jgi:hypothetical protein
MLTRHLYESDEVVAALLWCLSRGRQTEAIFWALELCDSELENLCEETLWTCWTYTISVAYPEWPLQKGSLPFLASLLASASYSKKKDPAVLGILALQTPANQPDRVGRPDLGPLAETYKEGTREHFLVSAILQGKTALAWFTLSKTPWDILRAVSAFKHGPLALEILEAIREKSPRAAAAAASLAISCLPKKSLPEVFTPKSETPHHKELLEGWTLLKGKRARRLYTIPYECLAFHTGRSPGKSEETSLLGDLEERLACSPWWKTLQTSIDEAVSGDPDEFRMRLYDTAFPDDIPEEWSKEERAKSHGPGPDSGPVQKEKESLKRFWGYLVGSNPHSAVLWKTEIEPPCLAASLAAAPSASVALAPAEGWNWTPIKGRTFAVLQKHSV